MAIEPTTQDLENIEHTQSYWDERLEKNFISPIIGEPSPYGKELLEDAEALLSTLPHQAFIENSLRDFHSHLAEHIINNT